MALLVILVNVLSLGGSDHETGISVLAEGLFHSDEVTALNGETWLGLFENGSGYLLVPVELSVLTVRDPIMDNSGEETGKLISCSRGDCLLFLKSAGDVFVSGEVEPVLFNTGFVSSGDSFPIADGESINACGSDLIYSRNGVAQRICSVYENLYGEGVSIFWVGDLDGDGLNDLIVDDCAHYAITANYRIFLSSYAEDSQLVGEVASFMAISC